jgi:hypothetical protein
MTTGRPCLKQFVLGALPGTMPELIIKSGVSKSAVFRAIRDARAAGEVRISKWQYPTKGGRPMPTYVKGAGKDAKCRLKPQTTAVSSAKHRKRAMKDGRWELRNAAVRARYRADKARQRPQTWFSALMPSKQTKSNEAASSAK